MWPGSSDSGTLRIGGNGSDGLRNPLGVVDISAGTLPWLSFAGAWGDGGYVLLGRRTPTGTVFTHLRVGDSPPGPAFHDVWRNPLNPFRTWPADDGH